MEPFALVFMIVSMSAVTVLAGYCLARILRAGKKAPSDQTSG